MKVTFALLAIITEALLFAAMFLHPILLWLSRLIFCLDMIALASYWHEVARSEEISMVSVLLFALGILIAVLAGGAIL